MAVLYAVAYTACAQKVVGADLSLVPAYETAGDKWKDADNHVINTYYSDGMITYFHQVAGINSVRVRLLVDPSQDSYVATCQDINYVKQLGKRIKDEGMYFLLDIFYSDTWTDVSQQWIPVSWGYGKSTATATVAAKVKAYTTEVLNTLYDYGAAPDFVQIGNEVSYGFLWDSLSGKSTTTNIFYCDSGNSYNTYKTQIQRFATILNAAAQGVRESSCADAKIVLHCERTTSSTAVNNFYSWVNTAGFTDYDVCGLSYYPEWHGALSNLDACLATLQANYPTKEVQIVETAYPNSSKTVTYDTSSTWAYSPAGQADFLEDLINKLGEYSCVTGLYYWQPEECGNGANSAGTNQVMDGWDNRGFWDLSWKSTTHSLNSSDALMTLNEFLLTSTKLTKNINSLGQNLDFEDSEYNGEYYTSCPGWTIDYSIGFSDGPWPKAVDQWHSSATAGTLIQAWNASGNSLNAGNIIYQTIDNLPPGTYTITADIHTDYNGIYLFANSNTTKVTKTTTWGTSYNTSVATTLDATGSITLGLKFNSTPSTSSAINLYADNFNIVFSGKCNVTLDEEEDNTNILGIYDAAVADITVNRPVKAGYNTFVLPFSMTDAEVKNAFGTNAKVYQMDNFDDTYVTFNITEGITANRPCLLYAGKATTTFTLYGKTIDNGTPETSKGGLTMTGTYAANCQVPVGAYVLSSGTLYPTANVVNMKAFRAYFTADSQAKEINVRFDDSTIIQDLQTHDCDCSSMYYDISGRRVNRPTRGIYIHNGKKIMVR